MKYFLLLTVFLLVACEQTTTEEGPSLEEGFGSGSPVVSNNGSSPDDGSGGATESWGVITFERTYAPYFEQFANSNKAIQYKLEFYANDELQKVQIGELEVYQKVTLGESSETTSKSLSVLLQPASTTFQKLSYHSGWDELQDGNLTTYAQEDMTKFDPAIIDFDFDLPMQVDMIKVSFHLEDITNELPNKMIIKKNDPLLGWVKIYEVTNLDDERFDDLKLDQLTTFKITQGPDCQHPLFLNNLNECVASRVLCSDLANAFLLPGNIPCEVLYNDSVVDCIAAGSDINCNDSISANLCQDYSAHHNGSGKFKVRTMLETVIREESCN